MQEKARHVIIPSMWVWTERLPGGRLLRWLCVFTAVLAALVAGIAVFDQRADADSYDPVGSQPWDRMAAEGYDYNTYKGENIAVGYETAEQAFAAWQRSPSHNHAMLDGSYRVIGIARINDPDSVHGWYWTTDFGGVTDPSAHAPGESPQPADTNEEPDTPDARE